MPLSMHNMNLMNLLGRGGRVSQLQTNARIQGITIPKLCNGNLYHFRSLYVLSGRDVNVSSNGKTVSLHHNYKYHSQLRWANTSSGSYAPNKLVTSSKPHVDPGQAATSCLTSVFEDNEHLPSLAVPNIQETMNKLKECISPMAMNSAEFVSTLQLIEEFSKTAGPKLELLLHNKAEQTKNWLTHDWWQREVYMKSRSPLIINSNPGMIYPQLPFEIQNQQSLVNTISLLISGIIDFELALVNGYNPEATNAHDEFHLDSNLCYSQYKHIFGSLRIPRDRCDEYHLGDITKILGDDAKENSKPLSLVLSYKGHFYEISLTHFENEDDRIDKVNGILSKIICHESQATSDNADKKPSDLIGPGVLTAAKRDTWAQAFKLLDPESMNAIQDAHFLICIESIQAANQTSNDDAQQMSNDIGLSLITSEQSSGPHKAALSRQVLHSDPANIGNRWFDKPIQLIIVSDDKTERLLGMGVNYEHSLAEGQVVSKMIEYSFDKTVQKHREMVQSDLFTKQTYHQDSGSEFRQLRMFDTNNIETIGNHLKRISQDYCSQIAQFDLAYMNYRNYGSNAIKSWRYSPDSWFQCALQLGYYNLHKRLGACYESASTRRFAFGRTETIRSLTKEVAQFCFEPTIESLQSAVSSHKSFVNLANNGKAIDRVLSGYRWTFDELRANKWNWGYHGLSDDTKTTTLNDKSADKHLMSIFDENELNIISAFFNNELVNRSSRYALSTSQVSSSHPNIVMSYGPALADGYGCCYNISGQRIVASITANSSNQSFSCEAHKLHESLEESLDTMRDIVEKTH